MKDSYMIFVLLAIMVTPFLPIFLKGKCPNCNKRKLETLEMADTTSTTPTPFISYFCCGNCQSKFMREKSGPLQAMSATDK